MRQGILYCVALLIVQMVQGQVARHVDSSRVAVGNRSYSHNTNVNRNANYNTNVNRNVNVNNNVNVNRNVNVHGNYYGGYRGGAVVVEDNSWNWGSFAAGAAAGVVTGAVVGAATSSHSTTVVAAPVAGTVVTTLPGSCSTIASGASVIYNCNNIHYQPFYQGTALVYQVVQ